VLRQLQAANLPTFQGTPGCSKRHLHAAEAPAPSDGRPRYKPPQRTGCQPLKNHATCRCARQRRLPFDINLRAGSRGEHSPFVRVEGFQAYQRFSVVPLPASPPVNGCRRHNPGCVLVPNN
jgi:hypothetical protein